MKKLLLLLFVSLGIYGIAQLISKYLFSEQEVSTIQQPVIGELCTDILQSIPSPLEISSLIKEVETGYNETILTRPELVPRYTSDFDKALNLGALVVDMGYANLHGETQAVKKYYKGIQTLAQGLEVAEFFPDSVIELTQNLNNLDSLLQFTAQNFEKMNTKFEEQSRQKLGILMLAGGWLEALQITGYVYSKTHNEQIKRIIGEQKVALEQIKLVLEICKDSDKNIEILYNQFLQMAEVYSQVKITIGKCRGDFMYEKDGELIIKQDPKSNIEFAEDIPPIAKYNKRNQNTFYVKPYKTTTKLLSFQGNYRIDVGLISRIQNEIQQSRNRFLGNQKLNSYSIKRIPEISKVHTQDFKIKENAFVTSSNFPNSTFSIEPCFYHNLPVNNIEKGQLPNPESIELQKFINSFIYDYAEPSEEVAFKISTETALCPWNSEHKLVQIGLRGGLPISKLDKQPNNFVFVIDMAGGMEKSISFLKKSLRALVKKLDKDDKVSVITYPCQWNIALPTTSCNQQAQILEAIDQLRQYSSPTDSNGMDLAYQMAEKSFIKDGNNRVILMIDEEFNVGELDGWQWLNEFKEKQRDDIGLTICGVNYYHHIFAIEEKYNIFTLDETENPQSLFEAELSNAPFHIAENAQIQVSFNPKTVKSYRLLGYENIPPDKLSQNQESTFFNPQHTVTAIYEIIPMDGNLDELMNIALRYKKPDSEKSILITHSVKNSDKNWKEASENFRFASAVAEFGETFTI